MTSKSIQIRCKVMKGMELTYQRLIKNKSEKNLTLVVSDNGRVVHVDPDQYLKNNQIQTQPWRNYRSSRY